MQFVLPVAKPPEVLKSAVDGAPSIGSKELNASTADGNLLPAFTEAYAATVGEESFPTPVRTKLEVLASDVVSTPQMDVGELESAPISVAAPEIDVLQENTSIKETPKTVGPALPGAEASPTMDPAVIRGELDKRSAASSSQGLVLMKPSIPRSTAADQTSIQTDPSKRTVPSIAPEHLARSGKEAPQTQRPVLQQESRPQVADEGGPDTLPASQGNRLTQGNVPELLTSTTKSEPKSFALQLKNAAPGEQTRPRVARVVSQAPIPQGVPVSVMRELPPDVIGKTTQEAPTAKIHPGPKETLAERMTPVTEMVEVRTSDPQHRIVQRTEPQGTIASDELSILRTPREAADPDASRDPRGDVSQVRSERDLPRMEVSRTEPIVGGNTVIATKNVAISARVIERSSTQSEAPNSSEALEPEIASRARTRPELELKSKAELTKSPLPPLEFRGREFFRAEVKQPASQSSTQSAADLPTPKVTTSLTAARGLPTEAVDTTPTLGSTEVLDAPRGQMLVSPFDALEAERRVAIEPAKTVSQPVHSRTDVAKSVVQQMAAAVTQSNDGSFDVRLSPEELGRVKLAISPSEVGILVSITAERPDTLELVRRNIELLAQDLKQSGFQNPTFDFEQNTPHGGHNLAPDFQTEQEKSVEHVTAKEERIQPVRIQPIEGGLDIRL